MNKIFRPAQRAQYVVAIIFGNLTITELGRCFRRVHPTAMRSFWYTHHYYGSWSYTEVGWSTPAGKGSWCTK